MHETIKRGISSISGDPRHFQILSLLSFVWVGCAWLDFGIDPLIAAATIASALISQIIFYRIFRVPSWDLRSPMISSLSLCLLLRTNSITIAVLAAVLAIGSKFVIRWRGKHIFNPTNIAIIAVTLASSSAWVSPGQWGSAVWSGFLFVCLGGLVLNRSRRSDIGIAVIALYAALVFGRAIWLGDPLSIPSRQMQSGALLIFAFFMISDPKTTPDSRAGRIIFSALVVAFAGWVQFGLYRPNGLLYGLALLAPVVPLIDRLLPGGRFEWKQEPARTAPLSKGINHEPTLRMQPGPGTLSHGLR